MMWYEISFTLEIILSHSNNIKRHKQIFAARIQADKHWFFERLQKKNW